MIHDLVLEEMQSFAHINGVLKTYIAEALTQCERCVKAKFKEPNLKEVAGRVASMLNHWLPSPGNLKRHCINSSMLTKVGISFPNHMKFYLPAWKIMNITRDQNIFASSKDLYTELRAVSRRPPTSASL